ncbi:NifB/NifX family molybdenum-iron cluster-binding protein [Caminicella sporogenes]|uniref:NifB/NifX family molybdenum-iron cluster-binding protein n=1 Tax=Caminicella sporogenes TaxID=166485 RepID=UPI002541B279|nr:NifB/NifX family molybdenum-iron cluster-binding protein [Caminicella sporogenes]WIF94196.1 NifB/NifX family molybdenum-iron cluster-binding protein [Caminicella sporogenes]
MKICISSLGNQRNSSVDLRFGRCKYFAIYDDETKDFKFIENENSTANNGAGIASAQEVIDNKVDIVITGNVGPNAMKLLKSAGIKIYEADGNTVEEVLNMFKDNKLKEIEKSVNSHFGLGNQHRRGW